MKGEVTEKVTTGEGDSRGDGKKVKRFDTQFTEKNEGYGESGRDPSLRSDDDAFRIIRGAEVGED
jgi:hypothetical protein